MGAIKKLKIGLLLGFVLVVGVIFDVSYAAQKLTSKPFASIEYGYSNEVKVGTIRYISQVTTGKNFNWDYWPRESFGKYVAPGSECGTAACSMALSYIGIDKTPKVMLNAHDGATYWVGWGADYQLTTVVAGMKKYIEGNGTYSPVLIHLINYSKSGHYLLLVGENDDGTYEAIDPWENVVTKIMITENSAIYEKAGKTVNDTINRVAQWYNKDAIMNENDSKPSDSLSGSTTAPNPNGTTTGNESEDTNISTGGTGLEDSTTGNANNKNDTVAVLDLTKCKLKLGYTTAYFEGEEVLPDITIFDENGIAVKGRTYKVQYENAFKPGTATVVVKGYGNSSGQLSMNYYIKPLQPTVKSLTSTATGIKITWEEVYGASGYYIYRNNVRIKNISSSDVLSFLDTKASQNDTKYSYKIYAYTISNGKTLISKVSGTKYRYYYKRPEGLSLLRKKNSLNVTYKENDKAAGYQLQISEYSNFKNYKTVKLIGSKKLSYTFNNLNNGKKYYVRVRAYKTVGKYTFCSAWTSK